MPKFAARRFFNFDLECQAPASDRNFPKDQPLGATSQLLQINFYGPGNIGAKLAGVALCDGLTFVAGIGEFQGYG